MRQLAPPRRPERTIIHLNVADFAVAVERLLDSRLRNRPVIIAPTGAGRTVVYDMSEEAYQAGVRKGMPLRAALRTCRDAAAIPPRKDRYERAMAALFRQALPYSPRIETGAADGHLFADVTGTYRLFGPSVDVAWRLARQIRKGLGFDPIWSVAPNKLVAKVATRLVKPSGEYVVAAGEEASFLSPLPLTLLPGLEPGDLALLGEYHFTRTGEILPLSPAQLAVLFGRRAGFIHATVRGIDPSPVLTAGETPPRVVREYTFPEDTNTAAVIESRLYRLVEEAGAELRKRRLAAQRIGVFIDYADGLRRIRQATPAEATAHDFTLFDLARTALYRAWTRRVRIRHLRLACDRLTFPPAQLALFDGDRAARRHRDDLIQAIDAVRGRFGPDALCLGRTLAGIPPEPTGKPAP